MCEGDLVQASRQLQECMAWQAQMPKNLGSHKVKVTGKERNIIGLFCPKLLQQE